MSPKQLSLRTFTENVIILAVENCLVRRIPDIFEPVMVNGMDEETVERLGAETDDIRNKRRQLQLDLRVLEDGLYECKQYRPRGFSSE